VKVTKNESDLLDCYCQAQGTERADYLRKSIFSRIHTWAKSQPVPNPAPVASPIIVAEKAPELPVEEPKLENQALPTPEPEKKPKRLQQIDYNKPKEPQTPALEPTKPRVSPIKQFERRAKPSDNQP
jgi:hypothetical protein